MYNSILKQFHCEYFFLRYIVQRWILSQTFKDDINNDYGIYSDYGEVVMEAVDQNGEYEEQAADGEDEYDNMYQ